MTEAVEYYRPTIKPVYKTKTNKKKNRCEDRTTSFSSHKERNREGKPTPLQKKDKLFQIPNSFHLLILCGGPKGRKSRFTTTKIAT